MPPLPQEESVFKELPPGALPELPDNRGGDTPSEFDKLDGFGDPYDWF
ncbi:hypothetical protein IRY61_05330 [Candidatus Saccharibacteria bacterium]|nr:hypothetical protein [Candidatus Saccharibacteria bacterium]